MPKEVFKVEIVPTESGEPPADAVAVKAEKYDPNRVSERGDDYFTQCICPYGHILTVNLMPFRPNLITCSIDGSTFWVRG